MSPTHPMIDDRPASRRGLRTLGLALVLFCAAAEASGQRPSDEIPAEARRRLEYLVGSWDSTWDYLGPDGSVIRSITGSEIAAWSLDGRLVELSTVAPEMDAASKAYVFYSQPDEAFYLVSVDSLGDLWVLSGALDEYVITSRPKQQEDGREMVLRITHHEEGPDSFRAVMEYTLDGGVTWTPGFRQRLTRRAAPELLPAPEPASPAATAPAEPTPPTGTGAEERAESSTAGPPASPGPSAPSAPPSATDSDSPLAPACDTLRAFDSDGDGSVTALDRYWRHLRLWLDDGDGRIETAEVESLYERKVRSVGVRLRTFRTRKDVVGDVWLEAEGVRFDLAAGAKPSWLLIDADGLARSGELELLDGSGAPLSGLQPLRRGVVLALASGGQAPLRCP